MAPSSHLHPRSTATSTLFAGTLLASFIVVGIPHVFPCPRPRRGFSDSEVTIDAEGKVTRKAKQRSDAQIQPGGSAVTPKSSVTSNEKRASETGLKPKSLEEEAVLFKQLQEEAAQLEKDRRECPVPKPKGVLGRWLGFSDTTKQSSTMQSSVELDAASAIISKSDELRR